MRWCEACATYANECRPLRARAPRATMFAMINVEVQRHGNENIAGLMRRFSRKVQSSGVVKRMRSLRYYDRSPSATQCKKDALMKIKRTAEYMRLYKEGRELPDKKRRR